MNGLSVLRCVKKDSDPNLLLFAKNSTQTKLLSKEDLVALDTVRKKQKLTNDVVSIRTTPPPAVARRNARERNRVKQVNNGFANLRQHIPNSIAATFESGKNGNKKLSKVETLRMAVEYIRSLEDILELNNDLPNTTDKSNGTTYQSSLSSLDIQSNSNYSASLASPLSDDDVSNNSLPSPVQYLKISGPGDTYQLIPMNSLQIEQYIKSENITELKYKNVQLLDSTNTTPLSPEIYSENSLSPGAESDIQSFIPVFNVEDVPHTGIPIKIEDVNKLPSEEMRILCRNLIMLQGESQEVGKQLNINELISW